MKISSAFAAGAALFLASGTYAVAQEEAASEGPNVYTFTGTIEGTTVVGGVGAEGEETIGASWTENFVITSSGNATEVTANCVGMDQPSNSLFDRHFACSAADGEGQAGGMVFGCNNENEEKSEMSCVGYFQGREGGVAGHVSLLTAYYWFTPEGTGRVQGSGHWIR
ncbi:MAG: hypothetical protein ABJP48_03660 [Erythrobacter sp.]